MPKPSLELSEIQLKVLDELEILSDAYISTFNELGKYIKNYSGGNYHRVTEKCVIPINKFSDTLYEK